MSRLRLSVADAVGRITLARPEKKNALDRATADELHDVLQRLERDDGVRVVLIDAEGEDFCAGADLAALEAMLDAPAEAHREDAAALGRVFVGMRRLSKPVIAAVQGRALAGGAGLVTACDIALAREDASFGYPEVRIGFVPAMVMTMLRRLVGERIALDLVLTGRVIDAREAQRIGLVSRAIPSPDFLEVVERIAAGLAKSPPSAVATTKRLFHELDGLGFEEGIALGVRTNAAARSTEDFRQGVRRFIARRSEPGT